MGTPKKSGGPAVLPTAHRAVTKTFVNEHSFTNFAITKMFELSLLSNFSNLLNHHIKLCKSVKGSYLSFSK